MPRKREEEGHLSVRNPPGKTWFLGLRKLPVHRALILHHISARPSPHIHPVKSVLCTSPLHRGGNKSSRGQIIHPVTSKQNEFDSAIFSPSPAPSAQPGTSPGAVRVFVTAERSGLARNMQPDPDKHTTRQCGSWAVQITHVPLSQFRSPGTAKALPHPLRGEAGRAPRDLDVRLSAAARRPVASYPAEGGSV